MIAVTVTVLVCAALVVLTERRLSRSLRAFEARIEAQAHASFKQQKVMTRRLEQSKRVADKVVQDARAVNEKVETVIKDPKVQRVLNRHEGV